MTIIINFFSIGIHILDFDLHYLDGETILFLVKEKCHE